MATLSPGAGNLLRDPYTLGASLPTLEIPARKEGLYTAQSALWEVVEGVPGSPISQLFQTKQREDDAENIIYAIVGLERRVDMEKLVFLLKTKLITLSRFRSITVSKNGRFKWIPVEVVVENHVKEVELPAGTNVDDGDPAMDYANHLLSRPMDMFKPLWEVFVLRNATKNGDSLIFRIHHVLGDGISLASLFLDIVDTKDGRVPALPMRRSTPAARWPEAISRSLAYFWNTLCGSCQIIRLLMFADPPIGLKVQSSVRHLPREVGGIKLSLKEMKDIGSVINATVNDVLVAIVAAAMEKAVKSMSRETSHDATGGSKGQVGSASLLPDKFMEPEHRPHAIVVVNLRPPLSASELAEMRAGKENAKWGTIVGYVAVKLPANKVPNSLARLAWVKSALDKAKNSLEAFNSNVLMNVICSLFGPKAFYNFMLRIIMNSSTGISNLPGPQEQVLFLDNPVISLQQFMPGYPQGSSFHMISYAGTAHLCVTVDAATSSAKLLSECLTEAFEDLKLSSAAALASQY